MKICSIKSPAVIALCEADQKLDAAINLVGDIEIHDSSNPFEFIVTTIIGQMLSNKVADIIEGRFRQLLNEISPSEVLSLSNEQLRAIGLSNQKSQYILGFAEHCDSTPRFLDGLKNKSDAEVVKELTAIRGIGNWTAKMYLLFLLKRPDILPVEDGAFLQAYSWLYKDEAPTAKTISKQCECWHPYASTAARYLYRLLDMGYTKYDAIECISEMEGNNAEKA